MYDIKIKAIAYNCFVNNVNKLAIRCSNVCLINMYTYVIKLLLLVIFCATRADNEDYGTRSLKKYEAVGQYFTSTSTLFCLWNLKLGVSTTF